MKCISVLVSRTFDGLRSHKFKGFKFEALDKHFTLDFNGSPRLQTSLWNELDDRNTLYHTAKPDPHTMGLCVKHAPCLPWNSKLSVFGDC